MKMYMAMFWEMVHICTHVCTRVDMYLWGICVYVSGSAVRTLEVLS